MGTADRRSALGGWATFVAVFLLIVGGIHVMWGIAALANDAHFRASGLVVSGLTFWGWVSIVVGAVEIAGGALVFGRRPAGQVIALLVAILGTFTSVFTLGAYPVWSLIALATDMLIIWAVTVHADEFVD